MKSLRKAINAMCKDCIYDPNSQGTWRQQIAECRSPNCALFLVRPMPINTKTKGAGYSSNLGSKNDRKATFIKHEWGA